MKHRAGIYEKYIKRAFDAAISAVALTVLLPLIGFTALLVRVKLGSPVLFKQQRPGKDGRLFMMYKFRTMTDERDGEGNLLPDAERLTRFGKLLRSTSIDELPELWSVLCGKMSLVGPRPLLSEYLTMYNEEQMRRHEVLPGLTGLAQVNGRNTLSWEDKFAFDVWYVDHVSFINDIKIIVKTVGCVFSRKGISAQGSATMEPFTGSVGENQAVSGLETGSEKRAQINEQMSK